MNASSILYYIPQPFRNLCALPIAIARPDLLVDALPLGPFDTLETVVRNLFGPLSWRGAAALTAHAGTRLLTACGIAYAIHKACQKDKKSPGKKPHARERLWTMTCGLISLPATLLAVGTRALFSSFTFLKESLDEGDEAKYKTALALGLFGVLSTFCQDKIPPFGALEYLFDKGLNWLR